jgi:hypothetical protein
MYCIAREKPDDFALYALDLALTGKGRLGGLEVAPGEGCRNSVSLQAKERRIAPADWVTLASLRDSTGSLSAVYDNASITGFNDPLYHLPGINALPLSYVCPFIDINTMIGEWMGSIPNPSPLSAVTMASTASS